MTDEVTPEQPAATQRRLVARPADLSRSRPPRWAWRDRIVMGYLNLLLGNEGIGKGTVVAWLLAQLTLGKLPGNLTGTPICVAVIADEDGFDAVWTPRLHAAGADLARVIHIDAPDAGYISLNTDRDDLAALIAERDVRALFLDQLLDNLGAGTDDWRNKAVRDALQPARWIARELDVAVLGAMHPNKRAETFRQLVSGASAFNAVSRSSLYLAEHPDDEDRRVLARGKGNLAKTPDAVELRITGHRFTANGVEFDVPKAVDFAGSDLTVDDLLDTTKRDQHSQVAEAAELIAAMLPRDGQWHPAKPLFAACGQEGIEDHTVKRAKQRLSLEHRRTSGFPAAVEWRWPTQHAPTPSVPTVPSDSRDTHLPSGDTVPTTPSVPTDTQNTQNTEHTLLRQSDWATNGHDPDAELERLTAKWGGT